MSSPFSSRLTDFCKKAAKFMCDFKNYDRQTNLSAMHDIRERLQAGNGVLLRLRDQVSVKRAAPMNDDDENVNQAPAPPASQVQKVGEDPDRKGKLDEENALRYLQELHTEMQTTTSALQTEEIVDLVRQAGDGTTLLVVPSSSTHQWMEEIRKASVEGAEEVLLLNHNKVPPFDLFRYKLIITSYAYEVSEHRRLNKFKQDMQDYKDGKNVPTLKRPHVTLLSGVSGMDGAQRLGGYLVG